MPVILTNKHNLPEIFEKACLVDNHVTRGDISTTQLVDAPQIRYLRAHNEIEEDISDRVWMLFGSAMHNILERAEVDHYKARAILQACEALSGIDDSEVERGVKWLRSMAEKLFPEVFESEDLIEQTFSVHVNGMEISGTLDKYKMAEKKLEDYKLTKTWSYVFEESRKKWYAQQNMYAYMLREHGYEVKEANIIAFYKDWSQFNTFKNKDYPKSPIMEVPVKLYPHKDVHKYIAGRVDKHKRVQDGEIIPCTGKERWATSDSWAVMKPGRKSALRVLPEEDLIDAYMLDNRLKYPGMEKIFRPGEQKRCEQFCPVRSVCPQWAKFQADNDIDKIKGS